MRNNKKLVLPLLVMMLAITSCGGEYDVKVGVKTSTDTNTESNVNESVNDEVTEGNAENTEEESTDENAVESGGVSEGNSSSSTLNTGGKAATNSNGKTQITSCTNISDNKPIPELFDKWDNIFKNSIYPQYVTRWFNDYCELNNGNKVITGFISTTDFGNYDEKLIEKRNDELKSIKNIDDSKYIYYDLFLNGNYRFIALFDKNDKLSKINLTLDCGYNHEVMPRIDVESTNSYVKDIYSYCNTGDAGWKSSYEYRVDIDSFSSTMLIKYDTIREVTEMENPPISVAVIRTLQPDGSYKVKRYYDQKSAERNLPPYSILPSDDLENVVAKFYSALKNADGEKAIQFVVPEKRNKGAFVAKDMTSFYSSLKESFSFYGLERLSKDVVEVSYNYSTKSSTCYNTAKVTLRNDNGKYLIESIVPEKSC